MALPPPMHSPRPPSPPHAVGHFNRSLSPRPNGPLHDRVRQGFRVQNRDLMVAVCAEILTHPGWD